MAGRRASGAGSSPCRSRSHSTWPLPSGTRRPASSSNTSRVVASTRPGWTRKGRGLLRRNRAALIPPFWRSVYVDKSDRIGERGGPVLSSVGVAALREPFSGNDADKGALACLACSADQHHAGVGHGGIHLRGGAARDQAGFGHTPSYLGSFDLRRVRLSICRGWRVRSAHALTFDSQLRRSMRSLPRLDPADRDHAATPRRPGRRNRGTTPVRQRLPTRTRRPEPFRQVGEADRLRTVIGTPVV